MAKQHHMMEQALLLMLILLLEIHLSTHQSSFPIQLHLESQLFYVFHESSGTLS
jgi:hypothetical protein